MIEYILLCVWVGYIWNLFCKFFLSATKLRMRAFARQVAERPKKASEVIVIIIFVDSV